MAKDNFIESYYMSDLSICDDLINLFENSDNKILGETSDGVDKNIKDSLDLQLSIDEKSINFTMRKLISGDSNTILIYRNINHHKHIIAGTVRKQISFHQIDI